MKQIFFLLLAVFLFSGCAKILPYETEFTCVNQTGGHCGSALDNHKSSMNEAYEDEEKEIDYREYKGVE